MNCPDIITLMENLDVYIENNDCLAFKQCFKNSYYNIDKKQLQRLELSTARRYVMDIYAKRGHRRDNFNCGGLHYYFDALSYSVEIRHLNEMERIDDLVSSISKKIEKYELAKNVGSTDKVEVINKEIMLLAMSFPSQESYLKQLYLDTDEETAGAILSSIAGAPKEYEESIIVFLKKMKRKRGKILDQKIDLYLKSIERSKERLN